MPASQRRGSQQPWPQLGGGGSSAATDDDSSGGSSSSSAAALERRRDRGAHGASLGVGATSRRGAIHKKGWTSPRTIGRAADAPASLTAATTKTAATSFGTAAAAGTGSSSAATRGNDSALTGEQSTAGAAAAATGGVVAPRREELRELFGLGAGTYSTTTTVASLTTRSLPSLKPLHTRRSPLPPASSSSLSVTPLLAALTSLSLICLLPVACAASPMVQVGR